MIDREIVTSRLSHIHESLDLLRPILDVSPDEYQRNPDCYLKAERLMEIIAQAMIDICAHVAAAKGLPKAEDYRQLADILADRGIISETLRGPLQGIFALRNILAHQYLILDRVRFQAEVKAGIGQIEAFCSQLASQALRR
jgi:uncharacterized protein YutE (UPF0331/DUF86 family)